MPYNNVICVIYLGHAHMAQDLPDYDNGMARYLSNAHVERIYIEFTWHDSWLNYYILVRLLLCTAGNPCRDSDTLPDFHNVFRLAQSSKRAIEAGLFR